MSDDERRRWFFRRSYRRFRGRRRSAENRRGETTGVEGVSGEEAANGLERRERETNGGRDADRRSFSGEVAGVIRNHRDGAARGRRNIEVQFSWILGNYPVWARAWYFGENQGTKLFSL
ncbi:hypothetical protein U1Q18_017507 [Sarracenia purpurea var. burkii]